MRLQDFIAITLGCQIPWNVHQRCLSSMRYCSPHHYTPTSESVDFLNTVIGKALISSSVYPSSSITSFQQEPRLVAEPNCSPALLWPYSMCQNPLKSDLTAGQTTALTGHSAPWILVSGFHLFVTGR